MASLFSILTCSKPTKELLYSVFSIIPANYKITHPQVQFILASLQYWAPSNNKALMTSISQLSTNFMPQIESGEEKQIAVAKSMISVLTTWYNQALSPGKLSFMNSEYCMYTYLPTTDSFKKDKALLLTLSKLADCLKHDCPKEWQQGKKKLIRQF